MPASRKRKRLLDTYRFPGFRPEDVLKGVFGDPKARVIKCASKIMVDRVKQHPKIELLLNTVVTEVLDVTQKKVTGVRVKNLVTGVEHVRPTTGLFIAIGHEPNTRLFRGHMAEKKVKKA